MPVISVVSEQPGAGKTGVAAAIARHLAYQGTAAQLARIADGDRAAEDAAFYAGLDFVPGTSASTIDVSTIADRGPGTALVVEGNVESLGAVGSVVLVTRGSVPGEVPAGVQPVAVVVTDVPVTALESVPSELGGVPVVALPEDRVLAGFSVSEIRALLRAEVLVEGEPAEATSDYLVIAPIGSDAGQPYFLRFESKAVVGRFDKTDMHLAALRASPNVLILSGGRHPSDYVFDAARAMGVPVLLSANDTENTVIALEGIWDRTRFHGQRKLDRMAALLEGSVLFQAVWAAGAAV